VAEVTSKFGVDYHFLGFGHLGLFHFSHDFEFRRDLQEAAWFVSSKCL
jgi:hypothetical protein